MSGETTLLDELDDAGRVHLSRRNDLHYGPQVTRSGKRKFRRKTGNTFPTGCRITTEDEIAAPVSVRRGLGPVPLDREPIPILLLS